VVDETVITAEEKAAVHREVVAEEEEEGAAVPMVVEETQITITATATCLAPIVQEAVVVGIREAFQGLKLPQKTRMPVTVCVMRYVEEGLFLCYAVVQRTKQRLSLSL
jgi:hypothetical protein